MCAEQFFLWLGGCFWETLQCHLSLGMRLDEQGTQTYTPKRVCVYEMLILIFQEKNGNWTRSDGNKTLGKGRE